MKILFGRSGFANSTVSKTIKSLEPSWEIVDGQDEDFYSQIGSADVVSPIVEQLPAHLLHGSHVRLVQQFGIGVDQIDLAGARRLGIPVANLPGDVTGNADSVAELAVYFTISLLRQVETFREIARQGQFPAIPAPSVYGRRILLIGMGSVGKAIALRLAPFGVFLVGVRANPAKGSIRGVEEVHPATELHEQLAIADLVILCAPSAGAPILDAAAISAIKEGGYVVNVGRGTLIDERALLDALDAGAVAGAGLDVLQQEPPSTGHPLVTHERVIVTPHTAGWTEDSVVSSAQRLVENLRRLESGVQPFWVLN